MSEMGHIWPSSALGSRGLPERGTATPIPELTCSEMLSASSTSMPAGAALRMRRGASVTLAGTIISIVPILLAHRVIIEFHALDDMVTEPDADIGVRLYVAGH